ncbi:MAG: thioredoxin [Alphaproteobacteria bacterium GM7ARS4]|nr:thioredoxin [Alphaproteobacteria bacterium GM7ARS4]
MPTNVTDSAFDKEVVQSSQPVVVDFWAQWCGPCKQIAPFLEEIEAEKKEQLKVVKVDIDTNPQTPQKYNVRALPTLVIFRDGKVIATKIGALPKSEIQKWIEETLDEGGG